MVVYINALGQRQWLFAIPPPVTQTASHDAIRRFGFSKPIVEVGLNSSMLPGRSERMPNDHVQHMLMGCAGQKSVLRSSELQIRPSLAGLNSTAAWMPQAPIEYPVRECQYGNRDRPAVSSMEYVVRDLSGGFVGVCRYRDCYSPSLHTPPQTPFPARIPNMTLNRLAIASPSLGQHWTHTLPQKIVAAAEVGIEGIEITHPDLSDYATASSKSILEAARNIRKLCAEKRLVILAFASFQNFEGQTSPLAERLHTAREWLAITHALGAAHLQVPSNYDRSANGDPDIIKSDLQQLADLAGAYSPAIKIAYENLGWGTHCLLWQQALQIVRDVNRENFGLCLDSFHFCAALWGDPYDRKGIQLNGRRKLEHSLREMITQLPLKKLFYLQLSDGELMDPPYSAEHPWYDPTLEPGHVWSNEARPFPLETELGAYMPVHDIARAFLVDLGYTGWVSLETFDRRMRVEEQGPVQNARRAVKSWEALCGQIAASKTVSGKL